MVPVFVVERWHKIKIFLCVRIIEIIWKKPKNRVMTGPFYIRKINFWFIFWKLLDKLFWHSDKQKSCIGRKNFFVYYIVVHKTTASTVEHKISLFNQLMDFAIQYNKKLVKIMNMWRPHIKMIDFLFCFKAVKCIFTWWSH